MSEILYRGKTVNEWVYGSPHPGKESGHVILFDNGSPLQMVFDWVYVDSETVGQYTGLNDKNGVKIFEGDIIKNAFDLVGYVQWHKELASFFIQPYGNSLCENDTDEVIGNIHDNPELLEDADD